MLYNKVGEVGTVNSALWSKVSARVKMKVGIFFWLETWQGLLS
jgi:hypothetical protein